MNLYHALALTTHFLKSKISAGFGLHSPVSYRYMSEVIKSKGGSETIAVAESLRRDMLKRDDLISITDLGVGSRTGAKSFRKISAIARSSAVPRGQLMLLSGIVKYESNRSSGSEGVILELGTSLGISTACLASAVSDNSVFTVEGCPKLAALAKENIEKYALRNVEIINAEFSDALVMLKKRGLMIRLAFIDGNHSGEALKKYFSLIMEMSGENLTIIADDIHLNRSMLKGWRELCDKYSDDLTIELFRYGIFIRNSQVTSGSYKLGR